MKTSQFFSKLMSRYLWLNIAAMAAVVLLLCIGVKFGLDIYTHHGEAIPVPNIEGMDIEKARAMVEQDGLRIEVADSGYNRRMAADCVLAQEPSYGAKVKAGHIIRVTINSPFTPSLPLPDIINNSSVRVAEAKLKSMGFKLLEPEYINGEKDWVYGVKLRGRQLSAGNMVPTDASLTLVVGNGQYESDDVDIDYTSPDNGFANDEESGDEDTFEEVPSGEE